MANAAKFSGWEAVKQSITFVSAHAGDALRVAGPWVIAMTIVSFAMAQLSRSLLRSGLPVTELGIARASFGWLMLVALGVSYGAIAVAWHRLVLRSESQPGLALPSRRALIYALAVAALYAVLLLPVVVGEVVDFAMRQAEPAWRKTFMFIGEFLVLPIFVVSTRLVLKLPAIAVDDRKMTLAQSWRETAKIWPNMLWGMTLIWVPAFITARLVSQVLRVSPNEIALAIAAAASYAVTFGGFLLYATFLSLAYQRTANDISATFE